MFDFMGRDKRINMSEEARTSATVLLCYFACCIALTILGRNSYAIDVSTVASTIISVGYYVLLWLPPIICCIFFDKWCDTLMLRRFLFTGMNLFYVFTLATDSKAICILLVLPFLVVTIAYGSMFMTGSVTGFAALFSGIYVFYPIIFNDMARVSERLPMWEAVISVVIFLNIGASVVEKKQISRNKAIKKERNRLKSLVAVGISRIFEYDVCQDRMMIAKSINGEYGDERFIDNFSEAAKKYRYVLFADWERLDMFVSDARAGLASVRREMRLRDSRGDYRWYVVKGTTIFDDNGKPEKIIGLLENIDDIKKLEIRKADENMREHLTKLYRKDYAKELAQEFLTQQNEGDTIEFAGLLALDIDNFGIIDELMGKAFSEEILKNIAADLEQIFYPTDILCRVGGDQFFILMKNIKKIGDIDKKIKEIQKVINRTYVGENMNYGTTVGIGAAVYPNDGDDFETLYLKAEKALFHAKKSGKNCYAFYDANLESVYSTYPIEEKRANIMELETEFDGIVRGTSDSLIELAFKLIDESKDTDSAINLLIRQVARQMHLGGIRIKKRVGKDYQMTCPYQCTMDSDNSFEDSDMKYSFEQWTDMLEEYRSHEGLIAYENIETIDNTVTRQIMLANGAKSYVGCAFYDKGEFVGCMDFIDFNKSREWSQNDIMTFRAVANVVSSYLLMMKAYEDASDTVERLTGYDSVTGLLMYEKFLSMAGEFIENAPHGNYAVTYMDFSNFKYINETYGYETGDKILKELAQEAESYKEYYIYGSRVFSDNLVMLTRMGDRSTDEILAMFEKASKRFTDRIQKEYIDSRLVLDVGVCPFEICGRPVPFKNIISNANVARKRTKLPESPRCIVYDDSMGDELKAEVAYATDMENAFRNHEFVVYMQPKVNLANNRIEGAEALIRWKKQDGTLIFPNDFIPVFEKNKSITLLDYFVYDEVCKYIRQRIDSGKKVVKVSANVSRVHLYSIENLVGYIKSLIAKYKIPPKYLEFELTETVFTDKVSDTILLMTRLRELGVLVSMDDFGSGYSSLNVLTKLPLDVLKLDKEFLDDFENDKDEKIIIPSVIEMAKKLNLNVVCEGVETMEQVEFLKSVGCDYAQGYFYSRPIPQEQFDELLEIS